MTQQRALGVDRFGNRFAPGLPYARGTILGSTEDDLRKLERAWQLIRSRIEASGPDAVFNLSGLVRALPFGPAEAWEYDDEIAPALHADRLRQVALEHLGGDPDRHDVFLANRLTAALFASHLATVGAGDVVLGVSARYSHPVLPRSAARAGAIYVDTTGVDEYLDRLDALNPSLVVLTRLSVSYDLLDVEDCRQIISAAHRRGVPVLMDDAGGARVGPALAGQPRMLELGPELGATGLDKYGTLGPRLGLLAGDRELVADVRARAFELGLEARPMLYPAAIRSLEKYDPQVVRDTAALTARVAEELRQLLGDHVTETPGTVQLPADDILEMCLERAGLDAAPGVVPYEATAALAMLLLRDHGVLTVHFAGLPPGNGGLLLKFLALDTLERFGGPAVFAAAVDKSIDALAELVTQPARLRDLLFGEVCDPAPHPRRAPRSLHLDELIAAASAAAAGPGAIGALRTLVADAVADPQLVSELPAGEIPEVVVHQSPALTLINVQLAPGMHGPPHTHGMPAVIAAYQGREQNVFYRRSAGTLMAERQTELAAGQSIVMGASVIHSVGNVGAEPSRALHAYLGDLVSAERRIWEPSTSIEQTFTNARYEDFTRIA